ncbi:DC-STAMP domain-containing protein 1 [Austrofundulus limnaeus]|uniref:DC-STAMP domain-containing protein 1 n=1 Tax=Austrofundulus limnaeus TaxID=52670 RepID=A0A2I4CVB3_AUSLI|nr:PREDICTED: DC-STAMP domain-containing protein 1 [Austrofundulus limnaeus]
MAPTEPREGPALFGGVRRFLQVLGERAAEYPALQLVARAVFGAMSGLVLFLGIAHNLPLTFDLKLVVGAVFVGVCAVGGALASFLRCAVLLMLPSILGSRGQAYLMILITSILYQGPISNIQRNAEEAALSLSCNLDLQVNHSRMLWRHAIKPFILITQELMDNKDQFQSEALNVSARFQNIRKEVASQYGYDQVRSRPGGNSTQERFTSKTRMQCDSVVNEGVQRCADWFNSRWAECMTLIPVPVINHILCVCMKFHFLCDVMRVMTPWCREQIPVEGNFGQLFDRLNVSVDQLSREFSTELVLQEQQQEVLEGAGLDQNFTQAVRQSFLILSNTMDTVLHVLQMILSFTFITVFIQGFSYLRSYQRDICFDNVYVTSYFRKIDARRRRAGKRFLLPLKKPERKKFIHPWSPRVHPEELKQVTASVFHVLSVSLVCVVLLTVDFGLFRVLDIISRHTFTQFNITSSHHVDIRVGGDSMIARLLRTTISGFNSSSDVNIESDNRVCVSPPSPLPGGVYVSCVCCVVMVVLFSCLQVYTNRLRRVIAAFYYPKREKKRVLFLYNLQLHRQISSCDRKRRSRLGPRTVFQRLSRWGRGIFRHKQEVFDTEETNYAGG